MSVDCIELQGSSETLVITFNEMWNSYGDYRFWGEKPLSKLGLSAYGIITEGPNWFPVQETLKALRTPISESRKYKHVVLYGYSMGAYAAIKYSSLFNNATVLAFSPQHSIDPADCGLEDERYVKFFNQIDNRDMIIKPEDIGGNVYLFFDPAYPPDAFHVHNIPGDKIFGHLHFVPMRGAGHETIHAISSTSRLLKILDLALENDIVGVRRAAKIFKKDIITFRRSMIIKFASRGKLKWGLDYIESFGDSIAGDAWSLVVAGQIRNRLGLYREAANDFEKAYAISGDTNHFDFYKEAMSHAISAS